MKKGMKHGFGFRKEEQDFGGKEEKPEEVVVDESKSVDEADFYKMNKKEQVDLLKEFGVKKIPKYESERVAMLVKLHDK